MAGDLRSPDVADPELDGSGLRVAVVAARFNSAITMRLWSGAVSTLAELGVAEHTVTVTWVPGAFEVPLAARTWAQSGRVDAVICLGCVIRGETAHFEYVAGQCAEGIMRTALDTGVPVVFGVLTTENVDQALARSVVDDDVAGGHNVGSDAARVAVEMATWLRTMR